MSLLFTSDIRGSGAYISRSVNVLVRLKLFCFYCVKMKQPLSCHNYATSMLLLMGKWLTSWSLNIPLCEYHFMNHVYEPYVPLPCFHSTHLPILAWDIERVGGRKETRFSVEYTILENWYCLFRIISVRRWIVRKVLSVSVSVSVSVSLSVAVGRSWWCVKTRIIVLRVVR